MKTYEFTKVKGITTPNIQFIQENNNPSTVTVVIGNDKGEVFSTYELFELMTSMGCIERDGTIIWSEVSARIIPLVNGLVKLTQQIKTP